MKSAATPAYRRNLLSRALAVALVMPMASMAFAQDASSEDETEETSSQAEATTLDTVTVVGSRIGRAEIEGPAPVQIISRADIEREGFQTIADVLSTLTQNTSNSFTGDLATNSFTPNASVVNLRGLGPGYTLTLVDGRRLPDYPQPYNRDNSAVNVGAIPTTLVERIEILSGGASAIYGSDAVAGVINIVTRKNLDGQVLRGTFGTTTMGGGDSFDIEYSGGKTGDDWNFVYSLQYVNVEPIFASQRDFLDDTRDGPNGANVSPALSLIALDLLNGARAAFYPGADACDRFGYTTFNSPTRGLVCGSYTTPASRSISNSRENWVGYLYGSKDIGNVQLWGSVSLYDSTAKSTNGTEFWGTAGDPFMRTSSGATTSAYYDAGLGTLVQLQRVFQPFELGGNEQVTTIYNENTVDIAFGARGDIGKFQWDASVGHATYDYESDRPRLLAQAVHDYFLGPQAGFVSIYPVYTLDIDRWTTPFNQAQYQALSTRVVTQGETSASQANFVLSGDLFELPAGPLSFATVFEWARQTQELNGDPRLAAGRPLDNQTIYNLGGSGRIDAERERYAMGAEFRVPLFDTLSMQLAGRYDKYDDVTAVDDAVTYNIGLEYRPTDSFLLRGTYATSFRAPELPLLFSEGSTGFTTVLDQYACRAGVGPGSAGGPRSLADCNVSGDLTIYQAQTVASGNPNLEEEEGESFTVGFVWDIVEGLSFSADYYDVELTNAAFQQSAAGLLAAEANCRLGTFPDGSPYPNAIGSPFCQQVLGLIDRQVAPGTALDGRLAQIRTSAINTAISRNTGVDARMEYRFDTDRFGRFGFDLGYTLSIKEEFAQQEGDEIIDYRDLLSNDNQRSRVRGSVSWAYRDWTTTVFGSRLGSAPNFASTERLQPYSIYNLTVSRQFGDNVSASIIVNNVLNNTFREDATQTGYPFFNYTIGADPQGRTAYFRVAYAF
ncbi:TonB-dependent receptor plug domain-containing protein [Arenimonas alkanexedens]